MHAWLMSISAHPHLVLAVVFAVACAEAIAVVGTMVPAGVVMFVAGALIGAGALNGWLTLAVAALGAVVGDGLSYELGRHYHADVRAWWQARRHEAAWVRGEQFVERHGGKSIVFARFFAPVRAIVPLVVGAAQIGRLRFYSINIASALAWAPAHILPGVLFGASAALAEAVSARLAVALLLLAALFWLVTHLVGVVVKRGVPLFKRIVRRCVLWVAHWFPALERHLERTLQPHDPEFATLSALALVFIGSIWLFGGVLQDVMANDRLMRADTALFTFLQSLHTAPIDAVMTGLAASNSRSAGLAIAVAVLAWLVLQRSWRTTVWWIIAVGVAVVLTQVVGPASSGTSPLSWEPGASHLPLPDGQAAFGMLVYGFLGWMLARGQTASWRGGVAIAVTLWIALGGIADLYLGRAWLSGLLGGWSLGLSWLALLAGAYVCLRVSDDVWPRSLALIVTGVLTVTTASAIHERPRPIDTASVNVRSMGSFTFAKWVDGAWQQLPARRTEISGHAEERLPLQWPASSVLIVQRLGQAGWHTPPAWSVRSALRWLVPQTNADELPVLPKYSQGESSELALVRIDTQQPSSRLVLRLWRSHYTVQDAQCAEPLWYGALYRERLYRPAHLITLAATRNITNASTIIMLLGVQGQGVTRSATKESQVRDTVLILPIGSGAPAGNIVECQ